MIIHPFKKNAAAWFLASLLLAAGCVHAASGEYTVQKVISEAGTEYRLKRLTQHFLSIIVNAGSVSIRPHPGLDPNGWGSSWYPQPFYPGATLHGARVTKPRATDTGITFTVSGAVSMGTKKS